MISTETGNQIAAFAGAGSAIAALITIWLGRSDRRNEQLVQRATRNLERSYLALITGDNSLPVVNPDRLAWLTCARLIQDYWETKKRIRDVASKEECEAQEEHWRHQFYKALEPINGENSRFFEDAASTDGGIELTSAVVVHAFASWPEGKIDPLDVYKTKENAIHKLKVHRKWLALSLHLKLIK